MSNNDFLPRTKAVIQANMDRAREDRILVVPPAIRGALYDLLHEEIQRLNNEARDLRTRATERRARLYERSARFLDMADQLAR